MPYRLRNESGSWCVQVKRESGWQRLKCYGNNRAKALAYLIALKMNVKH